MASHQLGTREQWAVAYAELRAEEKDLTRRNAALAQKRQALPWVPVEKDYRFETSDGAKTLAELFDGRSQLIVRHFMHGPKTPEGCPGCTFETDNHLLDLRPRHRGSQRDLATNRPRAEGPG
jgi:predicted dithiol-disulfide oxidoreductase (DUF899 family)